MPPGSRTRPVEAEDGVEGGVVGVGKGSASKGRSAAACALRTGRPDRRASRTWRSKMQLQMILARRRRTRDAAPCGRRGVARPRPKPLCVHAIRQARISHANRHPVGCPGGTRLFLCRLGRGVRGQSYRLREIPDHRGGGTGNRCEGRDGDSVSGQTHQVGPAVFGRFGLGDGRAIKYNIGLLFGLTRASPRQTLRAQVEYEF